MCAGGHREFPEWQHPRCLLCWQCCLQVGLLQHQLHVGVQEGYGQCAICDDGYWQAEQGVHLHYVIYCVYACLHQHYTITTCQLIVNMCMRCVLTPTTT